MIEPINRHVEYTVSFLLGLGTAAAGAAWVYYVTEVMT